MRGNRRAVSAARQRREIVRVGARQRRRLIGHNLAIDHTDRRHRRKRRGGNRHQRAVALREINGKRIRNVDRRAGDGGVDTRQRRREDAHTGRTVERADEAIVLAVRRQPNVAAAEVRRILPRQANLELQAVCQLIGRFEEKRRVDAARRRIAKSSRAEVRLCVVNRRRSRERDFFEGQRQRRIGVLVDLRDADELGGQLERRLAQRHHIQHVKQHELTPDRRLPCPVCACNRCNCSAADIDAAAARLKNELSLRSERRMRPCAVIEPSSVA